VKPGLISSSSLIQVPVNTVSDMLLFESSLICIRKQSDFRRLQVVIASKVKYK